MKKTIAVIGVGSPMGADSLALHVIESLKSILMSSPIWLQYYDRPGLYLLDALKDLQEVHLVDAMMSGQTLGTIHRYEDIRCLQKNDELMSSHGFGLSEVLALGETLNCLPPKVVIHGIEINEGTLLHPISKTLLHACQGLAMEISKELSFWGQSSAIANSI